MGQCAVYSVALIAEDDPMQRQELVDQFHAAGWLTLEAASGESSLALLNRGHEIGVAVIDVRLSGNMDGLELARVLRAIGCSAPVIYISGIPVETGQMVSDSIYRAKPVAARDMVTISAALLAGDPLEEDADRGA